MRSFPDLGVFGEQAGGVLLDDLAVVFDAEVQLSCAMAVIIPYPSAAMSYMSSKCAMSKP